MRDEKDHGWLVVKHAKLRDTFDMGDESFVNNQRNNESSVTEFEDSSNTSIWVRNGDDGMAVCSVMESELVGEDADERIIEDNF